MKHTYQHIILYSLAMFVAMHISSCKEDEMVPKEEATDNPITIRCQVSEYTVQATNSRAVIPAASAYEDLITKLDLLVFNGNGNKLKHLTVSEEDAIFTTSNDTYQWEVTGLIPEDYLRNSNYTICLIANFYSAIYNKDISSINSLTELQNLSFEDTAFNPIVAKNKGMVMVQTLSGSKFDEATSSLTFNQMERVMAKVELRFSKPDNTSYYTVQTINFEKYKTYKDGWTFDSNKVTSYWGLNGNSHFLCLKETGNGNNADINYNINHSEFSNASDWKLEFDVAGFNSNDKVPYFKIMANETSLITATYTSNWGNQNVNITNSQNEFIGTMTCNGHDTNTRNDSIAVTIWNHITIEGNSSGVYCTVTGEQDIDKKLISKDNVHPTLFNFHIEKEMSQWAIDNITLSCKPNYDSYQIVNFVKDCYLLNDEKNEKRTTNAIYNSTEGGISTETFIPIGQYPDMESDNGLIFYSYPNYWFDGSKNMSKEEPIIHNRQTNILVKARYIDSNGKYSTNLYYYEIPVNYRLPELNDEVTEDVKAETENYCRIQRNHHYIVNVLLDQAGGETINEALYIVTEPYADVVQRPEFN